jgi:hypothetical protein
MHKLPKIDLVLAFVIVCIAITLTAIVAFAAPGVSHQMHRSHRSLSTEETRQ